MKEKKTPSLKSHILFIHGRPGPHPLHAKFANSIGAEFHLVDPILRWHDKSKSSIYRYFSYLFSALFLKVKRDTIIFSQGIHFMPALAKFIHIFKKIKLVYLLDDEGLYFIKSNFYPPLTRIFAISALKYADGIICVGEFQSNLSSEILKKNEPLKKTTFNGVSEIRLSRLENIVPDLQTRNILFIGNGPGTWRTWYKGLDLMIKAFGRIHQDFPEATFTIVGDWDKDAKYELLAILHQEAANKVYFTGRVSNLDDIMKNKSIYLHVARGEAWGITVTEAMAAGIPTIVSDITGAAEVVRKVSEDLVIAPTVENIVNKIYWYFNLSDLKRNQLSVNSRIIAQEYTEKKSIAFFKHKFQSLIVDIDAKDK